MKPFLLYLLVPVLLATSCQKSPPAQPSQCDQVRRAPADFLAYWYFPKGSYWVYQKRGSQPAEMDTVTVIYTEVRVFRPNQNTYGLPPCTELYQYTLRHSNRRYFPVVSSTDEYGSREYCHTQEESGQWFVLQTAENMYDIDFLWSYPQRPVGQPIASTGPTLLDTLAVTVPAGTFHRSVHLRIEAFHDSTRSSFVRSYHLTRGIGTTRRVYANLGTWELRSYYIAPK